MFRRVIREKIILAFYNHPLNIFWHIFFQKFLIDYKIVEGDEYRFFENCNQSTHHNSIRLYTAFDEVSSFFSDECFMRKLKIKLQLTEYHLRWNTENMKNSIYVPQNILFISYL